ncbi:Ig-like domain-containing protein [Lentilactobacillus senioris]|uniref:Ig-like domain-containing protein n=1 Tax=Lentilactobacillus senioris TaxID=931534 RepID=UPI002282387D|nr:Ig-like domain-containing protein [Lentilactobacillus senioris]MCY9806441.1 Ig-like domain-containing protein [Lentilactobacillus senioris]
MKKIIIMMLMLGGFGLLETSQNLTALADTVTAQTSNSSTATANATPTPVLKLKGSTRILVGEHKRLAGKITNMTARPHWSSSNSKIIKVNQAGKIKGIKAGKATIKISYQHVTKSKTIKVTQQTSSDLSRRFKRAHKGQTITLVGNFKMKKDVKLPTAKNVKVKATKASFTGKRGFFYGIVNRGLKWTGGYFYSGGHSFRLLRTQNAVFNGLTFHQACGVGGHIFDLMGSKHVKITNCQFYGYGHTLNLKKLRKKGHHGEYAEAIQTDYANYNSGGGNFNRYGKGHFNHQPTSYVTVTHNTWRPEYSGKRLVSLAQTAIGEHDTISSNRRKIKHVTFEYNLIKNPIRLSGMGADTNYFGAPVHFESSSSISIKHNVFQATLKRARPENWIIISNQYGHMPHTVNVKISHNQFKGYWPSRSAVRLITKGAHFIKHVSVTHNFFNGRRLLQKIGHVRL